MHSEQADSPNAPLDRVKIRRFKKIIRIAYERGEKFVSGLSVPLFDD